MPTWQGFASLQFVEDLLGKLNHDYQRMLADHLDVYAAFDFFVTAEHMVDWRWPNQSALRHQARSQEPLATVSHLASGGKHFAAEAKHHRSVQGVDLEYRPMSQPALQKALEASVGIAMPLVIHAQTQIVVRLIQDDGSVQLISTLDLAGLVLSFWTAELRSGGWDDDR
jgi:hypothetical protein